MLSASSRPWYRVLENENVLEQHAARAGYAILYPETLSFGEQIRAFGEAKRIVGPSGSGMLNAVFAEDGAKVLDMESFHTTVRQHAKIYASTRKRYSFLFGQLSKDDGSHPIVRPWLVPEELFRVGIEWLGG
jgi:capsular polysaccharide biosynthesis protein